MKEIRSEMCSEGREGLRTHTNTHTKKNQDFRFLFFLDFTYLFELERVRETTSREKREKQAPH